MGSEIDKEGREYGAARKESSLYNSPRREMMERITCPACSRITSKGWKAKGFQERRL